MKPSGPGLFFVGSFWFVFVFTASVPLLVTSLLDYLLLL